MRTKIDFISTEGLIILAAHPRRGTWGQSTLLRGSKTFRSGGQLATCASMHTLLTVALTVALRDISNREITRLLAERHGLRKPRLVVRCQDSSFISALQSMTSGNCVQTLRAGKNFLDILQHQLSRYQITFQHADIDCTDCLTVAHWVGHHVHDPKRVAQIPPSLAPSAVSAVI